MSNQKSGDEPWEVAVFAALLNMRWAHHIRTAGGNPDLIHALDDAAETALGDIILQESDRLFLFELKSCWSRVRSEVNKPIFERYKELHDHAKANPRSKNFHKLLLQFLRCHHLAYWEDEVALTDGTFRGSISFSPYALFVLDSESKNGLPLVDFRKAHGLALFKNSERSIVEAASIEDLFSGAATAASGNLTTGENVTFSKLGLDREEFLDFVVRLRGRGAGGNVKLKLIAFSPVSGFVRSVSTLDEAVKLGLDWAEGSATTKPIGLPREGRTGKVRQIGGNPLVCSIPGIGSSVRKGTGIKGGK